MPSWDRKKREERLCSSSRGPLKTTIKCLRDDEVRGGSIQPPELCVGWCEVRANGE
jgi:hypothetical protein